MAARIAVLGAGYVGLTSAACLATLGHHVTCADVDQAKVQRLRCGQVDILEPHLADSVMEGLASGHLRFVDTSAVADAQFVFVCVPTPMGVDGRVDMTFVDNALLEIHDALAAGCVLVIKSTVPVGTAARLAGSFVPSDVAVVSNPEFLRQGCAVDDFLRPDRIVIGSNRPEVAEKVAALYRSLGDPLVFMDTASAELLKYAANGFLAMKLSYVNEIADLCERLGANIGAVIEGLGYDPRVGKAYLQPGPGWGGACLPKDTAAILHTANLAGIELPVLRASVASNERHQTRVAELITAAAGGSLNGKRIGLLGLAFKAGTNELRYSPAVDLAQKLAAVGADVAAYDPAVPRDIPGQTDGITIASDAYQAVKAADVAVLLTGWPQFRFLDWLRVANLMGDPTIVDTRNFLPPATLAAAGIRWRGIGVVRS